MTIEVNELSSTIDLRSTLNRAEVLFHRFQRTIQAIDRKDTFPLPTTASAACKGGSPIANNNDVDDDDTRKKDDGKNGTKMMKKFAVEDNGRAPRENGGKVISLELRMLLRRDYLMTTDDVDEKVPS